MFSNCQLLDIIRSENVEVLKTQEVKPLDVYTSLHFITK